MNIQIHVGDFVQEIFRAIRVHYHKFLSVKEEDILRAQLGLGHSYSRMKCMFDVNRQDKPVINAIALIDQLDKNINSFCMRIKEWFAWHYPELNRLVADNATYVKIVNHIQTRKNLMENKDDLMEGLEEICVEPELAKQIYDSACMSSGQDLNEIDLINIKFFCDKVKNLIQYREDIAIYLKDKMKALAPNVSALVGEIVAARLISHSGSLSNLAKYPASTIQILGAEKALFRALKTRGKTPKYGLLYHSSFIGKAAAKNKGKISRYLANKLAMCSRIDFFATVAEGRDDYGVELKNQVEERLKFLNTGVKPRKNIDVMKEVFNKLKAEQESKDEDAVLLKKKTKKSKASKEMNIQDEAEVEESDEEEVKPKKKKRKTSSA